MRVRCLVRVVCAAVGLMVAWLPLHSAATAATFNVNSTIDASDAAPGDGVCATAGGLCSLRGAIQESNELRGRDIINVPAGTYPISSTTLPLLERQRPLVIQESVAIQGAGAEVTIVDGARASRIMDVVSTEALIVDGNQIASVKITGEQNFFPFVRAGTSPLAVVNDFVQASSDLENDLLISSFTAGILRFDDDTGAYKGVFIPTTIPGVGSLAPGGLMRGLSPLDFNFFVSNYQQGGGILRFNPDGTFRNVFASAGSGGLAFPGAIISREFFQQGYDVLVVSTSTNNVLRFDGDTGNFIGTHISSVFTPRGMVERSRVIYLAGEDADAVFAFDAETGASQGMFVQSGAGGLDKPGRIQFGVDGDLYVQSTGTNQILRYDGRTGAFKKVFVQGGTATLNNVGPFMLMSTRRNNNGPIVNMNGVTLANGSAPSFVGAGLSVFAGASLSLSNGSIRDNESQTEGGGVHNDGDLHLIDTSVTGNKLPTDLGGGGQTSRGGGIYTAGSLRLDGCLIANNTSLRGAGIVVTFLNGSATIVNTTISNNNAFGSGGGIRVVDGGSARVAFSTITGNRANNGGTDLVRQGGGIFLGSTGRMTIGSSIIAGNTDGRQPNDAAYSPDCATEGAVILQSARDNVAGIVGPTCRFQDDFFSDLRFDQAGTPAAPLNAQLEPLANYGGPTLSHLLRANSPAVDMGSASTSIDTFFACNQNRDQRLQPRPVDGNGDGTVRCDAGSVEVRAVLANDNDGDGIQNGLDSEPQLFSFAFTDTASGGNTTGRIDTAGEQLITVSPVAGGGGVNVAAAAGGGATPAQISACDGEVIVQLAAGQSRTIACVTANAGPDLVLECTAGGAVATLNGAASSAAGGAPTFSWSAPGVTLQNATQAIATGTFPLGTKTATLTVSRRTASTTDSALVTVLDRTAPVLNVPADVTASSCTAVSIGQATASDGCGGPVTIVNNAPASFKAGVFTVTWRAVDRFGNEAVKTQRISVGLGDNSACCPAGTRVLAGTPSNDTLNGTSGADCILGKGGQDTIRGAGGNDFLSGGAGNDVVEGGDGNDFVEGGAGQDTLRGQNGNDTLLGMDGDDFCYGGENDDVIRAGQGQDKLFGENGNDTLFGDDGDDVLDGAAGNDALDGGGLHDQCLGGSGTNTFAMCES